MSIIQRIKFAWRAFRSFSFESNDLRGIFGGTTDAGEPVDGLSALTLPDLFAAIRVRSEAMSMMPVEVFKRSGDERTRARNHPAWNVLHDAPNPEMTAATFYKTLQAHIDGWGNGYAYIKRDGAGRVKELWPLSPERTVPVRSSLDGLLRYRTRLTNVPMARKERDKERLLERNEVLHVPGLAFDGVRGYNPIELMRNELGNAIASVRFRGKFFSNGAWMAHVLRHPKALSPKARANIEADFKDNRAGVAKAWEAIVLEEGMDIRQMSVPAEDALMVQFGAFTRQQIASMWRVPLHMLADLQKGASFASIEQTSREFVVFTLGDPLRAWELELNRKVFGTGSNHFAEFNRNVLLQGTPKDRFDAYKVAVETGWMSQNDVRRLENLEPVDGLDVYRVPLNYETIGGDDSTLR